MKKENYLVTFTLDDREYAFPLMSVQRVVRAAEITPLPGAPGFILGAAEVQGRAIPVVNTRALLALPQKEVTHIDQFILTRTRKRAYAFVADEIIGVVDCTYAEFSGNDGTANSPNPIRGVARVDGRTILIHDPESLLSAEETECVGYAHATA